MRTFTFNLPVESGAEEGINDDVIIIQTQRLQVVEIMNVNARNALKKFKIGFGVRSKVFIFFINENIHIKSFLVKQPCDCQTVATIVSIATEYVKVFRLSIMSG